MFPRILVAGSAYERGRQHGQQAAAEIGRSLSLYQDAFRSRCGWDWPRVQAEAHRFLPSIEAFDPTSVEEMRGIASGAERDFLDVLALNTRTEIFFRVAECSTFAFVNQEDRCVVAGQNWDWLADAHGSTIVLEAECEESPNFVSIVEAGLLAKVGMNSAGIGLLVNALASDRPADASGVPFHILLRAILAQTTLEDVVETITNTARASSGNYLVVDREGRAVDLETEPGLTDGVHLIEADDGFHAHTNHFISEDFDGADEMLNETPDSVSRLGRIRELVMERELPPDNDFLKLVLADHVEYPAAICAHHDPAAPRSEQWATVAGVMLNLGDGTMHVAPGNPCTAMFEELTFGDLIVPQPLRP